MGWVKLDDRFFTHPKIIDLSKDAKLVFLAGLTLASCQLTNGFLSDATVRAIMALVNIRRQNVSKIEHELDTKSLWKRVQDGYEIHDYLDYNPSSEQVREKRERTATRVAEWRKRNEGSNAVTNSVRNGVSNTSPVPVPVYRDSLSEKEVCIPNSGTRGKRAHAPTPPAPTTTGHERNLHWDALCEALGVTPTLKRERSEYGRAVSELKQVAATPDEIRARIARMLQVNQRKFVTINYILTHWSEYAASADHEGQHDRNHNTQQQLPAASSQPQRRSAYPYQPRSSGGYPSVASEEARLTDDEVARINSRLRPLPPQPEPQAS